MPPPPKVYVHVAYTYSASKYQFRTSDIIISTGIIRSSIPYLPLVYFNCVFHYQIPLTVSTNNQYTTTHHTLPQLLTFAHVLLCQTLMSYVQYPPLAEARETGVEQVDVLPAALVARSTQGLAAANKDGLGATVVVADHGKSTMVTESCNLCKKRIPQCTIYIISKLWPRIFFFLGGGGGVNLVCLIQLQTCSIELLKCASYKFYLLQVLITDGLGHNGRLRVGRTQLKVCVGIADPKFIRRALPDREDVFKRSID